MRATLTAPGYVTGLTRDEGRLFLLRATMLGAFYPNLLRGACVHVDVFRIDADGMGVA